MTYPGERERRARPVAIVQHHRETPTPFTWRDGSDEPVGSVAPIQETALQLQEPYRFFFICPTQGVTARTAALGKVMQDTVSSGSGSGGVEKHPGVRRSR